MNFRYLFHLIFIFASTQVFSQLNDSSTIYVNTRSNKKHITNTPSSIVYNSKTLKLLPAEKIDDYLKYIAGINSNRTQGIFSYQSNLSMSGLSSKTSGRVLLMHNGIPSTLAASHQINWNRYLLLNIDKIEVSKGTLTPLYGTNAIGGVINLVEKEVNEPLNINANISYGSYNTFKVRFLLLGKFSEKLSYSIAGYFAKSNGYQPKLISANSSVSTIKKELNEKTIATTLSYNFQPWLYFKLHGSLYLSNRDKGTSSQYGPYYRKQNTPNYIATIYGKYQNLSYDFTAYYIWEDFEQNYFNSADGYNNFEWADWIDTGFKLNSSYKFNDNIKINGGLDAEERSTLGEERKSFFSDILSYRGKYRYVSGYLQAMIDILPKLTIQVRGRYDNFSFYEADVTSSTNINPITSSLTQVFDPEMWHHISPGISITLNNSNRQIISLLANHGFKAGTLENYCRSGIYNSNIVLANPLLKPETFNSIRLSSFFKLGKITDIGLDLYYLHGENMISLQLLEYTLADLNVYQHRNIYKAQNKGIELSGNLNISDYLKYNFSYTFNNSEILSHQSQAAVVGKQLPFSPVHMIKSGIIVQSKSLAVALLAAYKSQQYTDELNTTKIDPYTTGDAKITYFIKNGLFSISLSCYDLFNNEIMENLYTTSPGSRFEISIAYSLK